MATTRSKTKRMTADEFFDWVHRPENDGKDYELVRGEVVEVGRPGERHGVTCGNAGWILNGYTRQRRRGFVLTNDAGIILERDPDTVRGSDVQLFDEIRAFEDLNPKLTEGIPRLIVEVLSPTDRMSKVIGRIEEFLRAGVSLVWLVDPEDRNVTVFRQDRSPRVVTEDAELTGEDILPDLVCRVADFFFMAGEVGSVSAAPFRKRRRK